MKAKLHSLIAIAALASLAPSISHAENGKITFTGVIKAQTCKINETSGGPSFTVTLPKVSTAALANGGASAGKTPFSISLTNCSPGTGNVFTHFETGDTINTASGNMTNKQGTATNVEVSVLNSDYSKVWLGGANENSKPVALKAGEATLKYYAHYQAVGSAATVGTVRSSVMYSIQYQ
ncbi:fimbrial protein [Pseudoxanthomonas beigongshangi]